MLVSDMEICLRLCRVAVVSNRLIYVTAAQVSSFIGGPERKVKAKECERGAQKREKA